MYSAANIKLEDEEKTDAYEKNKAELTEILKQLEAHKGEFYDLWKETREWSIDLMKKVYAWADVSFDRWYWESDVDADSVKTIKKYFAEGKLQESQGAIGLDFSAENLGFCLLLKSDGTGLYATKDVELARRKFEDFKIEKSIYVVDMRQALHFKQVFKTLEFLGFEQAKNCYHLQYNFVELPDGAMSSRKGNIIPLILLVDKMKAHVKSEYLARYANEWTAEEVEKTSDIVAKGAIKYGMVRQDTNKKIVFDMNEWLKLDGESGPFIQYSYARINSLIKKLGPVESTWNGALLSHPSEMKLMQHLMNLNTVILNSAENYKPSTLCTYLYDTAKKFNSFYHDCPIGSADTTELKQARLALAAATGAALKNGLSLLGIPVPERM
jgi:arginyl-tRNA synthetase